MGRPEMPSSYADFVAIQGDKSLSSPVQGLIYLYLHFYLYLSISKMWSSSWESVSYSAGQGVSDFYVKRIVVIVWNLLLFSSKWLIVFVQSRRAKPYTGWMYLSLFWPRVACTNCYNKPNFFFLIQDIPLCGYWQYLYISDRQTQILLYIFT